MKHETPTENTRQQVLDPNQHPLNPLLQTVPPLWRKLFVKDADNDIVPKESSHCVP
jgi:hypothetical protein